MYTKSLATPVGVILLAASSVSAKSVGYYESQDCTSPSDFESCYDDASEAYSDCVDANCEDQNIDCYNACICVQAQDIIDCAGQYCWNQVYSCEYQASVNDVLDYCAVIHNSSDVDALPFFPPPENADAGCSCNLGSISEAHYKTTEDLDACANNEAALRQLDSDQISEYLQACVCCSSSAYMSAFWNICPNTDPGLIGADQWQDIVVSQDDDYAQCGDYLSKYSCGGDLGFSSTGEKGDFYSPGDFPANGTKSLSNTGVVTSPVSGATYSYTIGSITKTVGVENLDANPTGSSNSGGSDNDDSSDNEGDDSSSGGSGDGDDDSSSDSNSDDGDDDDEGTAALVAPRLLAVAGLTLVAAAVIAW